MVNARHVASGGFAFVFFEHESGAANALVDPRSSYSFPPLCPVQLSCCVTGFFLISICRLPVKIVSHYL